MTERAAKSPEVWPSIARLAATFAIFMFHYLGQTHRAQYRLDFCALVTFCLISGYLSSGRRAKPGAWLIRRYFSIMIPYWIVIIPVVFMNHIEHYKVVTLPSAVITILGGSLFLREPLYVIGWYITFILLLYCYGYVETYFSGYRMAIPMVIAAFVFAFWLNYRVLYFVSFFVGLRMRDRRLGGAPPDASQSGDRLAETLFFLQRYCYPFFLVHGAVLLMFTRKAHLSNGIVLLSAFAASCICAIVVYALAKPIQTFVIREALGLAQRIRIRPAPG